jgi:RHS repeat-associated protein
MRLRIRRPAWSAAVGVLLVASFGVTADAGGHPGLGAAQVVPSRPDQAKTVKVKPIVPAEVKSHPDTAAVRRTPARVTWPTAGSTTVDVPAASSAAAHTASTRTSVGSLPVRIAAVAGAADPGAQSPPRRLELAVRDRAAADQAGVDGLLLSVRRADGQPGRATVALTVHYAAFEDAYGGDWATRLRLVARDASATVTGVRNDADDRTVSAEVSVDQAGGVLALTAGADGAAGDYKATSLSPSGSWQMSTQGGSFSWSYPMQVPPVPGGLLPDVTATYSSSSTDGRVVATNNQPSWLGEGWDLWPGYIERSYKPCMEDKGGNNGSRETGDLCWETDNATMSFGEHSSRLVFSGGDWRPEDDDGTKVERFSRGSHVFNGDNDGEYWRVTTPDGTRYHFGLNRLPGWTAGKPVTFSTWTVPVFGNDPAPGGTGTPEPCHEATFAESVCNQAYRWNLDYVVDPNGNSISYHYRIETNHYGQNMATAVGNYVRGGSLEKIEYGTRNGAEYDGLAPAVVKFDLGSRCAPGKDCALHNSVSWPDVPWDRSCQGTTCPGKYSPTFWSTQRLTQMTTKVLNSSGTYRDVDRWSFAHAFPLVPDGGGTALWLDSVTRTGLTGPTSAPTLTLPRVSFEGTMLPNRVDSRPDGLPALHKPRIGWIRTESGTVITVNYAGPQCSAAALPAPATNTQRCFPVRWVMPPATEPVDDWFHKHVVASVIEDDGLTDADDVVTTYRYTGGGAWAFDNNPLVPEKKRSWSVWRGFENVTVIKGDPVNDEGKKRSRTDYLYFRGMHGDRTASGGTKTVNVTDSTGAQMLDREALAGFPRERMSYDGATVVEGEINDPWVENHGVSGHLSANQVETARTVRRVRLADGSYRRTQVDQQFDNYGNATRVNDLGEVGKVGDERCTTTTFNYNTTAMLVQLPSEVVTVGVACGVAVSYPADAVSHRRIGYDGAGYTTAPTHGDATTTMVAKAYNGSTPVFMTSDTSTFDDYGRVLTSTDVLNRETTTSYLQVKGLTTVTTVTNPKGHVTKSTVDPARGNTTKVEDPNQRVTVQVSDALGRLSEVYLPGRSTTATPNLRFTYGIRTSGGPNWVRTEALKANGNTVVSFELLDGLLRSRQTQVPSAAGGSVVKDTRYDSRGLVSAATEAYHIAEQPSGTLQGGSAGAIPSHTVFVYDGMQRRTDAIHLELNASKATVETWRAVTAYGGDRVTVYPPTGGTVTTTYTDARDRVTALRQWRGRTTNPTDSYDETRYTYTKRDDVATVTDATGNVWRYSYDVLGNKVTADDPDSGVTMTTYDDAGQMLSTTDARNKTTAFVYDALGRKIQTRLGSATGTLLTETEYDSLSKGDLTATTRWVGGSAYTRKVTSYDVAGRPMGEAVTIPALTDVSEPATTYTSSFSYKVDGSIATRSMPALGDLPAETLNYGYNNLGMSNTLDSSSLAYVRHTKYTFLNDVDKMELGPDGKRLWRTTFYDAGTQRVKQVLTERENAGEVTATHDMHYAYDHMGNITRISNWTEGAPVDSQCFGYDHLRRVTTAWTEGAWTCSAAPSTANVGGPAPYWHQYGYDAIGNRRTMTAKAVAGNPETVRTYTYPASGNGADRPHALTSVTSGSTTASYAYDASGNMTTRPGPAGTQTLTWDDEGMLASIATGDRTTSYVYDAEGTLLIRRDTGSVTLFVGGGQIRLDTATRAKTGTRYYDGIGTRTRAGFVWTIADHHGTSQVAVNSSTLAATVRRTDLFGNPRGTNGTWPAGDRGFVGGTTNTNTGLTRLGAREYDPALGRFISVDPIIDPTDPQQLNAYAYANNNPATMTDPDGLKYFEGNDGRWSEVRPRSNKPRSNNRPSRPRTYTPPWASEPSRYSGEPRGWHPPMRSTRRKIPSIAHLRDPGARCRDSRRYCERLSDRWDNMNNSINRAAQHDFDADGRRGRVRHPRIRHESRPSTTEQLVIAYKGMRAWSDKQVKAAGPVAGVVGAVAGVRCVLSPASALACGVANGAFLASTVDGAVNCFRDNDCLGAIYGTAFFGAGKAFGALRGAGDEFLSAYRHVSRSVGYLGELSVGVVDASVNAVMFGNFLGPG